MKTPNKTPTGERPPTPTDLPKGLSFENREGILMPFLARWREPGGKKRARSFASAEERAAFVVAWKKQREAWGKALPVIHPRKAEAWRLFDELTGGADPAEVARFWLKYKGQRGGTLGLSEAIKRFHEVRKGLGREQADKYSHTGLHLDRLAAHFGKKSLGDLSTDALRGWLRGLRHPETGAELEDWTMRHHLKSVKLFFRVCVGEKWCDENPALAIATPAREAGEVAVLTIEDAMELFAVNRTALCIGRLALEAFAGLRFSSASRIAVGDMLFEEKGLVMPGHKHKTGRRHYVDGFPENLWAWLKHAPAEGWDLTARNYAKLKAEAFTRAKVNNPGNVLRHSFCTYHISQYKDAARTAVLLTHRSPAMLYQHYKGRASEADGKRYFEILP